MKDVASVREAGGGADVVITCTAAREPLVDLAWLAPGAHVTAVGSDGLWKQELDPEISRQADVLVVDSRQQSSVFGELQHAPDQVSRAVEPVSSAPAMRRARRGPADPLRSHRRRRPDVAANAVIAATGERETLEL